MARAHAHALHTLRHMAPDAPAARLVAVAARDRDRTEATAAALGFERATTDWRSVVEDPRVEIVANLAATDVHVEPCLRALELGKVVLCEKPLAASAEAAHTLLDAARRAGVVAVCAYNYRGVPALRLARRLIAAGRLGTLRHFRGCYLQDWANLPAARRTWRFDDPMAGSAVGDLSHTIDLLRWLVGEPTAVCAVTGVLDPETQGLDLERVDRPADAFSALFATEDGVTATIDGSRVATGWKGRQQVEVVGSRGTLWWDMEDLNRLHLHLAEPERNEVAGFCDILVTEAEHPFMEHWWPAGHIIGWEHTFAHEWLETLRAHAQGDAEGVEHPDLPGFHDGLRAVVISEAIHRSAAERRWVATPPG